MLQKVLAGASLRCKALGVRAATAAEAGRQRMRVQEHGGKCTYRIPVQMLLCASQKSRSSFFLLERSLDARLRKLCACCGKQPGVAERMMPEAV